MSSSVLCIDPFSPSNEKLLYETLCVCACVCSVCKSDWLGMQPSISQYHTVS